MSETSSQETRETRASRRRIERWLATEASGEVPAAEAALESIFDRRPTGRSQFADRVMAAAVAEGVLVAPPPKGRLVLAALAVGSWAVLAAGAVFAVVAARPGSDRLAAEVTRAAEALADGARVAHFGWQLLEVMRTTLLTILASPNGSLMVVSAALASALSMVWLGRLLAADASDATTVRLESA